MQDINQCKYIFTQNPFEGIPAKRQRYHLSVRTRGSKTLASTFAIQKFAYPTCFIAELIFHKKVNMFLVYTPNKLRNTWLRYPETFWSVEVVFGHCYGLYFATDRSTKVENMKMTIVLTFLARNILHLTSIHKCILMKILSGFLIERGECVHWINIELCHGENVRCHVIICCFTATLFRGPHCHWPTHLWAYPAGVNWKGKKID